MDRFTELENLILSGKRAHLVGIGGVSMSPLASVLAKRIPITGSDIHESSVIRELRGMGVTVYIGHRAENVLGADFVIINGENSADGNGMTPESADRLAEAGSSSSSRKQCPKCFCSGLFRNSLGIT